MLYSRRTVPRQWRLPALLASLSLMAGMTLQPVLAAKSVSPTFVDYAQCANGQPPSTDLGCPDGWINGILQASNSHYTEDQVTPQRAEVNVPTGASTSPRAHSMTFTYQARKGSAGTHAYDSLATWNWTQTDADHCDGLAAADCVAGTASTYPIPDDTTDLEPHSAPSGTSTAPHMLPASTQAQCNAYGTTIPSRCFEMYGGIIDSVSSYTHSCTATGDCLNSNVDDYATITIYYHTATVPQKVQLLFGGHLAVGSAGGPRTWGLGHGASNINGGPYHIKWDASDGASIGNRDNQIMGSAIIFQNTGITTQIKNTNGTAATGDDTNVSDGGHVNIGTVVYDTATLTGSTATAGGTVSYYYEKQTGTTADCSTGTLIGSAVTVTNGVVPASGTVTFSSSGTYEFWAVYSGDTNNNTSTSTCGAETVVVNADTATTTAIKNTNGTLATGDDTSISDGGHVNIGTVVYDTASLSGNTGDAGGTVSYYYEKQTGATADCSSGTLIGSAVTVTNGSIPASATVTFSSSGTYEFWAVYSGDTNNNGSTSTCGAETVVVNADTATTTQIKNTNGTVATGDDTNIADGGHVAIGTSVYDTASLSGNTSDAGGTVTYYYQKQTGATADCSSGTVIGSAVTVASGVVPASDSVSLTAAGTYEFWAVYSGDTNNNGSTSTCGAETVIVDKNSPVAHSTPVVQIKDTFSVTGFTSDATGSVTVGLYTSSTCTTGQQGSDATFTIAQAVAGAETTFVGVLANTYYFKISYAGDSNNSAINSCAEVVGVTITSIP